MTDDELIAALRERIAKSPRAPVFRGDKPAKCPPPAKPAAVEKATLTPLLARVYGEVADGGFGPAYGLFSIEQSRATSKELELPARLIPIVEWGCANWSCVDKDNERVVTVAEGPIFTTDRDLRSWLAAWLEGVDLWKEMFEPGKKRTKRNLFTGEPVTIEMQGRPRGTAWA